MTRMIMGDYHPEPDEMHEMAELTNDMALFMLLDDNPCTITDLLTEIAAYRLKVPLNKVYIYAPPMRVQKALAKRLEKYVASGSLGKKRLGTASGPHIYWLKAKKSGGKRY